MKEPSNAPFYAAGLYPKLAAVFRAHGYALAVHGSVGADFDLIAVPWVDEAGEPQHVIEALLKKFAFAGLPHQREYTPKPHGRIAYKLHLSFGDCALDISFTPRTGEWAQPAPRPVAYTLSDDAIDHLTRHGFGGQLKRLGPNGEECAAHEISKRTESSSQSTPYSKLACSTCHTPYVRTTTPYGFEDAPGCDCRRSRG